MPKRSRTPRPTDPNQLAALIVSEATGGPPKLSEPRTEKNPAAVALGRLGGLKGGKARAEKLSAPMRQQIARHAATERWKKSRVTPK